jgi:hypothetical protein
MNIKCRFGFHKFVVDLEQEPSIEKCERCGTINGVPDDLDED